MTDSTFSISTKASSYGCIWIQSPHTIDFTNALDILEILGLEGQTVILPASFNGSNVIEITWNLQVIQVYSSLDRSSDLKIGDRNNNLFTTLIIDDSTTNYCRLMEDICIPMITRFDRLMFVFKDLEGRIMYLNGEFEFQLTIEDRVEDEVEGVLTLMLANLLSMIEVFGSRRKEVKLDNPPSFDQCSISSVSLYTDFGLHNVPSDQVVVIDEGTTQHEVLIPRGAYDIETIFAMLKASDAFPVRIGVQWRERTPYYPDKLLRDRFVLCSRDSIDPQIRMKCVGEGSWQPTTILPEFCV